MTIWKDVVGYEGLYKVSDQGEVWSCEKIGSDGRRLKGRKLKGGKYSNGYMFQSLRKNGKNFSASIHRLVAEAHVPNLNNKQEINHIDGNKENNHYTNLEWCTRSENRQHAVDNHLHLGNGWKKKTKITNVKTGEITFVESKCHASRYFGFKKGWIQNKVRKQGNAFTYKNYIVEVIG